MSLTGQKESGQVKEILIELHIEILWALVCNHSDKLFRNFSGVQTSH